MNWIVCESGHDNDGVGLGMPILSSCLTFLLSCIADKGKYVTRSKTGSLTPKLFTDSVTSTSSSIVKSSRSNDDMLVINKDGDITRIMKAKTQTSSLLHLSTYFKLGITTVSLKVEIHINYIDSCSWCEPHLTREFSCNPGFITV